METEAKFDTFLKSCCKTTDEELDNLHGYSESNYQNALIHFLLSNDDFKTRFNVLKEVHINYQMSNGFIFGNGRADIILENNNCCYILELKANVGTDSRHLRKYVEQCRRYTHNYSLIKTCPVKGYVIIFNSGCCPIIKKIY